MGVLSKCLYSTTQVHFEKGGEGLKGEDVAIKPRINEETVDVYLGWKRIGKLEFARSKNKRLTMTRK